MVPLLLGMTVLALVNLDDIQWTLVAAGGNVDQHSTRSESESHASTLPPPYSLHFEET